VNHDPLRNGGRRAKKQNLALIEQRSEQKRRQITQLLCGDGFNLLDLKCQ
jgi:hypothetical protein